MNPFPPALALTGCLLLAFWGARLASDPGVADPFPPPQMEGGGRRRRTSLLARLLEGLGRWLAPPTMRILGAQRLRRMGRRLDAAGRPGGMTVAEYAGRRATWLVLFGVVGVLFLLQGSVVVFVLTVAAGGLWGDLWLSGLTRRRQARIDADLPDFLDVLAVTVGAGTGFRLALERVATAVGGPLGEEVTTALRQLDLGVARREAFTELRERNTSETLASFVIALLQAEELGAPLSDTLRELAKEMRRVTHQEARRRAARAAPRISLIVTMVIVPGAVVLILTSLVLSSDLDLGGLGG